MLLQLYVLVLSLLLFGAWGLPIVAVLRSTMPAMILSAPAFGAGLLAVMATLLFVYGVPIRVITIAAVILAFGFISLCRHTLYLGWDNIRRHPIALSGFIVFLLILSAPILSGNAAFTIFQGNQWDHFNYVTAADVFAQLSFEQIRNAASPDFLVNPLLPIAQKYCLLRPSVAILFAVIGAWLPGAISVGGYAFVSSFAIAGLLAFMALLLQLFGRQRRSDPGLAMLFAGAYACGFWGQYPLDIDAWSQAAAIPLLISAWALIIAELTDPAANDHRRDGVIRSIALAVLMAGVLYLYPEAAMFHGLILVGVSIVLARTRFGALRRLATTAVLSLLPSLLFWQGTIGSAAEQAVFATTAHVDWWHYFDAYLFGQDPALVLVFKHTVGRALVAAHGIFYVVLLKSLSIVSSIAGIVGVYFLMPTDFGRLMPGDGVRAIILVLVIAGLVLGIRDGWASRVRAYRLVLAAAGFGLIGAILLTGIGDVWTAGKALSFTAPFFCLAIVAPGLIARQPSAARWSPWAPWVLAQAIFAALALIGLTDPDGIRLPPPYPEIQDAALKRDIDWDIAPQLAETNPCRIVEIAAPNAFFRHYAALSLFERHRAYVYAEPVNSFYDVGTPIGPMQGVADSPDCRLTQQAKPDKK